MFPEGTYFASFRDQEAGGQESIGSKGVVIENPGRLNVHESGKRTFSMVSSCITKERRDNSKTSLVIF